MWVQYTCTRTHIRTHKRTHTHAQHATKEIQTCTHMHTCTQLHETHTVTNKHIITHIRTHTHTHTRTHTYTHTHTTTHTYTRTHIQTHTHQLVALATVRTHCPDPMGDPGALGVAQLRPGVASVAFPSRQMMAADCAKSKCVRWSRGGGCPTCWCSR